MLTPTQDSTQEQLELALECIMEDRTSVPDMTYEQGVYAALMWVLKHTTDPPMAGDE